MCPSSWTHEARTGFHPELEQGETGRLGEGARALGFQFTSLALVTKAQRSLTTSGRPLGGPGGSHARGSLLLARRAG